MKPVIPVFFASDDNYAPFIAVTLESILGKASKNYHYNFYVLTTNISEEYEKAILKYNSEDVTVQFVGLTETIKDIKSKFQLRDYYSMATYYRFFIADMFTQYDKALYLDCDIAVVDDISKLYETDVKGYCLAGVPDESMNTYKEFADYVEKALGVPKDNYFNAGIMVMNLDEFRKQKILAQFIDLMQKYKFRVAQDQDYLNVICKGQIKYLEKGWNKGAIKFEDFDESTLHLVHYNLTRKPWHKKGITYEEYFWQNVDKTDFKDMIHAKLDNYTDKARANDEMGLQNLLKKCIEEAADPENYYNKFVKKN